MKTVLVVDDEFSIVMLLAAVLEDEGYRVITAANGRQALERMAENKPDLIISDFMMPILDGAALGRTVRDDPAYRNIPMIMTSGLSESVIRERFQEYNAYLRKPFFELALLKVISEVLAR